MNYYEEILNEIKELIAASSYDKAKVKLETELSLPYVPQIYEEQFLVLLKEVNSHLNIKDSIRAMPSVDEMIVWLFDDELENQLLMVSYLKEMKITPFLDAIKDYLLKPKYLDIQSILIYQLIEAQIKEEIKTIKDGMEITFIPNYCELPQDSDGFELSIKYFQEHIKQNPSVLNLCVEVLHLELMHKLPFSFEEDDVDILAPSIVKYVYESLDLSENWIEFRDKYELDEKKMLKIDV